MISGSTYLVLQEAVGGPIKVGVVLTGEVLPEKRRVVVSDGFGGDGAAQREVANQNQLAWFHRLVAA